MSPHQRWRPAWLLWGLLLFVAPVATATVKNEPSSTPSSARGDSSSRRTRSLPLLQGEDGTFSISTLTRAYEKDLAVFLDSQRPSPVDLETLDRYGYFPAWDTPVDSTGTQQLWREGLTEVTELTPEEKDELDPPKPGVQTGIPSPVAVTGTLLGGLGLLVHVISKLF